MLECSVAWPSSADDFRLARPVASVGGQTQDESARGREDLRWRLPSRYVPAGDWKVQMPFQIFDNVYYVGNEAVSAYLITTSDGLVLIDTTTALMVNRTLDNIRQLGFDPADIEYVFITEAHEIHYGGAAQIKAETGATICMSAADWDFLEQAAAHADQPEYDWTTQVAPPRDHETQDGEVICQGRSKIRPRWRRKTRPPGRWAECLSAVVRTGWSGVWDRPWGGLRRSGNPCAQPAPSWGGGVRAPGRPRGGGPSCCVRGGSCRR